MNYREAFGAEPTGPCSIMRIIATTRSPDAPAEVIALATVEIMLDDVGCYIGTPTIATFGGRTGGCRIEEPACTPRDLARAIWEPYAPDVIVAHDLATERRCLPPAITGPLPWIGTLRVARRAWGIGDESRPSEIIARRKIPSDADPDLDGDDRPGASALQEVMQVTSLVQAMVESFEVRRWAAAHSSGAHALRTLLDEMLADFALQGMVDMSALEAPSSWNWPGPWNDDDVWRAIPLDDLQTYAGSEADRLPRFGHGRSEAADRRRRRRGAVARPRAPPARAL